MTIPDRESKLTRKELGQLLEMLGRRFGEDQDISVQDIESFLQQLRLKRGDSYFPHKYYSDNVLDETLSFLGGFSTSEELRTFIEVTYRMSVPYKLGRQTLIKLGVGVVLTSRLDLHEAIRRWEERERKIGSLNIYQMSKEQLETTLLDDELFPSGYSIITFAKKSRIKLPLTNNKKVLIKYLIEKLVERPLGTREIGDWGIRKKSRDKNEPR